MAVLADGHRDSGNLTDDRVAVWGSGVKQYPLDRFDPVLYGPMELAMRVRSKLVKVCLCLVYPVWFVALMPIWFPLLLVSIVWAAWDSVNEPPGAV